MGEFKVTDPMFAKAIADLSANNSLFFTSQQLYYLLDQRLKRKGQIPAITWVGMYITFTFMSFMIGNGMSHGFDTPWLSYALPALISLIFILLTFQSTRSQKVDAIHRRNAVLALRIIGLFTLIWGVIVSTVFDSYACFVVTILLGMSAISLSFRQASRTKQPQIFAVSPDQFEQWLSRWQGVNDPITQLLPEPNNEPAEVTVNPDVTAYSFDRLVVCDTAAIAQLLIANNFHFENNCAILSITGYPHGIFATTMEMVRRNPNLKVYAFHNCTPRGLTLVHHLRTSPQWFENSNIEIFDVGLLPRQVLAARGMFICRTPQSIKAAQQQITAETRQMLSAAELRWLEAGNFVELESLTPQRLIQSLNRGIAGSRDLAGDTTSDFFLISDTGYYSAADSFG